MSCSSSTKRCASGSSRKRGSSGGTLTRAKRSSPVAESRTVTARFSDRFEMYGNGCAGSTASGVSTGKMLLGEQVVEVRAVLVGQIVPLGETDSAFLERGHELLGEHRGLALGRASLTRARISRSRSTRSRPSGIVVRSPAASCSMSPATRTWKNSSRCSLTMARNLARSSSGTVESSASASDTRDEVEERELSVQVAHAESPDRPRVRPPRRQRRRCRPSTNCTGCSRGRVLGPTGPFTGRLLRTRLAFEHVAERGMRHDRPGVS